MKKPISQLRSRFAIATILAGAGLLAVAWPAAAEIVYTHTNVTIAPNSSYNLDVNNDGVTDFTISTHYSTQNCGGLPGYGESVVETPASGNGVEGSLPARLIAGDQIGPSQTFYGGGGSMAFLAWCPGQILGKWGGQWISQSGCCKLIGDSGYLGLILQINGETHYGWAHLDVILSGTNPVEVGLSGYAYETIADVPINAGQTKPAATTITLTSSPNPSAYGQAAIFTAVVASSIGAPPDGETVSFMKGKTLLGTGTLSGGIATFSISTLKVGTNSIKAVYGGDSNFAGSKSNTVEQVVEKAGE